MTHAAQVLASKIRDSFAPGSIFWGGLPLAATVLSGAVSFSLIGDAKLWLLIAIAASVVVLSSVAVRIALIKSRQFHNYYPLICALSWAIMIGVLVTFIVFSP